MSNKLKGVWVEGFLWESKDFKLIEKHLLQKLKDLDNDKGCTAMNGWLADFLGISKSRVSQLISKFKKQKLISVKLKFKGKEVVGRVIRILKGGMLYFKEGVLNIKDPVSFFPIPSLESSEVSNIVLSNRVKEYNIKEEKYKKEISLLKEKIKKLKKQLAPITDKDLQGVEFPSNFTPESIEAFKMFLKMRKEIKEPFRSPTAIQTKVNSLGRDIKTYGIDAVLDAIRKTTENQWRGIKVNWGTKKAIEPIIKETKKFPYPLPDFLDAEDRQSFFYVRFDAYKPFLDIQKVNTIYKKRALYQKDAEGLCFELELKFPKLAEMQIQYNRLT